MKIQSVYIEVQVSERLPEKWRKVIVTTNYDTKYVMRINATGEWDDDPFIYINERAMYWLEKKEGYFFTKEELEEHDKKHDKEVAGDAFDAGYNSGFEFGKYVKETLPNKKQYLANLIK